MSLALSQPLLARGSSVDWNEYLSSGSIMQAQADMSTSVLGDFESVCRFPLEKESSSTLDLILAGNRLAGKRISDVRQGK
mmetsp:Transcript_15889/g.26230  ORF Transcript_15889/g.26230 Transcript_15889/m.26230 type:complete len:80 (-) Transcript_15889:997-1236(-)